MSKKIGTLGPDGSHSSYACRQNLKGELVFFNSIASVLEALSKHQVDKAVVPIENQLGGSVNETLDCLASKPDEIELTGSFVYSVKHAVGMLNTSNPAELEEVLSHPQALAQCSEWLNENARNAVRTDVSSTSLAVEVARNKKQEKVAAIAPLESLEGFTIATDNAGNQLSNKTRFIVVERKSEASGKRQDKKYATLFLVEPKKDRKGLLFDLLEIISGEHGLNLLLIQSRPDAHGWFVFHFSVEGHKDDENVKACIESINGYVSETGQKAKISVFGSIPLTPFYRSDLQEVSIVGGKGEMGKWLGNLFVNAGLGVHIIEKNEKPSTLKKKLEASDAVVISVPMEAVPDVVSSLKPMIKPGQLVVENCSVKSASLPLMKEAFVEGVEILGMHTMFGPGVSSLSGENVVFTRTESSAELAVQFEDLFYKFGAVTTYVNEEDHDKVTACTQALTHFLLLAYADTLKSSGIKPELLEALSTPNSRALVQAASRIAAELSSNLQTKNKEAVAAREAFLKKAKELDAVFDQGRFTEEVKRILSKN